MGWDDTYHAGVDQGVLELGVPRQELLVQERGVGDVAEHGDVYGVGFWHVLEVEGLEEWRFRGRHCGRRRWRVRVRERVRRWYRGFFWLMMVGCLLSF